MIEEIKLFILVLSSLFCLADLLKFTLTLTQEDPTPIKLGVINKILLYFATSYIITTIIIAIFT